MNETEKGLAIYSDFFGEEVANARRAALGADTFAAPLSEFAVNFVFGSIWSRDGLERKQRSLVTMAILIATRQTEELKKHVQIGLRNGLTPREIEEVLIHSTAYLGFPAVATATEAVAAKFRELGIPMDKMGRNPG